jgi:hypothetical protein
MIDEEMYLPVIISMFRKVETCTFSIKMQEKNALHG